MVQHKLRPHSFGIFLLLFSFSLLSQSIFCQEKLSMIVGGVELSLGMKRDEVLKQVRDLKLDSLGNDAWMILQKNLLTDEFEVIGHIQFIRGKLYSVSKDWGKSQNEDAAEVLGSLFSALNSVTSKSGTNAQIQTYEQFQPGVSYKYIVIHVNDRSFTIIIDNDSKLKLKSVQVDERIIQY